MRCAAGILGLVLSFCLSACSLASPLDQALKDYVNWKHVSTSVQTQGNITNVRSDGEYSSLLSAFNGIPSSKYPELVKWVEAHYKEVPSPIYWDLAVMAQKEKKPVSEILKWMSIGQNTGHYDVTRCRDKTSSGAYVGLLRSHKDLMQLVIENPSEYFKSWESGLKWLKAHPYAASPMWVCSHGISAFGLKQSRPVSYEDLVTPDKALKVSWEEYLAESSKVLGEYQSGKRAFP